MPELKLPDRCKISVAGRLVRDAEVKKSKRGHDYCVFTVARNVYRYGNEDTTEHQSKALYFECRAFGIMLDRAKALRKGHSVLVDGIFDISHYYTVKGERAERLEVKVEDLQTLEWPQPHHQGKTAAELARELDVQFDEDEDPVF